MNHIYYFGVIVRLFAIALFIFGIGKIEFLINFSSYTGSSPEPSAIFSALISLFPILISIFIWFFPLTVAKKILPSMNESIEPITAPAVLTVLVLAIGTYSLYFAISDSAYWITIVHIFVRDEFGNISKTLSNQDKAAIFSTVIELVIAILLIAKAKTISRLLIAFAK